MNLRKPHKIWVPVVQGRSLELEFFAEYDGVIVVAVVACLAVIGGGPKVGAAIDVRVKEGAVFATMAQCELIDVV